MSFPECQTILFRSAVRLVCLGGQPGDTAAILLFLLFLSKAEFDIPVSIFLDRHGVPLFRSASDSSGTLVGGPGDTAAVLASDFSFHCL